MREQKLKRPIVIDNGSFNSRSGFSGEDKPQLTFRTVVDKTSKEWLIGKEVLSQSNVIQELTFPIEYGMIVDWDAMKAIWKFTFNDLGVNPSEHPVLLTEPSLNDPKNRVKIAEIMFEQFNVPSLCIVPQAFLSLHAENLSTGLVVDIGDTFTSVTPIYEELVILNAVSVERLGGRDITKSLRLHLQNNVAVYRSTNYIRKILDDISDYTEDIVREIKERCCYVSLHPSGEAMSWESSLDNKTFHFPNYDMLIVREEQYEAPEILFGSLEGLVFQSIQQTDMNLRSQLAANIVLTGGSSVFRNLEERLHGEILELRTRFPEIDKINIIESSQAQFSSWLGGSKLSSMENLDSMWITKKDYEAKGPAVVNEPFSPKISKKELKILGEIEKFVGEKISHLSVRIDKYPLLGYIVRKKKVDGIWLPEKGIAKLPNSLKNLNELEILHLGGNKLTSLPEWIGELSNINTLILSYNKIKDLPENFGKLSKIQRLWLNNNQLKSLPKSIENLTQLKELAIFSNKLTTIPKSLRILEQQGFKINWNLIDHSLFLTDRAVSVIKDLEELLGIKIPQKDSISHYTFGYKTEGEKIVGIGLVNEKLTSIPSSIGEMTSLRTLYLGSNRLTSIPESVGNLTNLEELDLQNNQLTSLPNSIGNLVNLQKFNLEKNQLTSLPDSIGNLIKLQRLPLQNNQLTSLPERIGKLTNLQSLILDHNRLTSLPHSIGNLKNLKSLYISENQLTSLPESMKNLTNLNQLQATRNPLLVLPEAAMRIIRRLKKEETSARPTIYIDQIISQIDAQIIEDLGELVGEKIPLDRKVKEDTFGYNIVGEKIILGLSNKELTSLPESIVNLKNLQALYLQNNQLTSLPDSIGNLTNLEKLNLENNLIRSLPESLGNLKNLEYLHLEGNQLTSLPKNLGKLANLRTLDFRKNQLTSLPDEIVNLTKLRSLILDNNHLTFLPENLGNLKNLEYLYLEGNQLTSLPESLGELTNLHTLRIHENQLTNLLEGIGNLTKLRYLIMGNNKLTFIPEVVGNLTKVHCLGLEGNQLTSLPDTLENLKKLDIFDISNNQFSVLPKCIGSLTGLSYLRIVGNQLISLPENLGNLSNLEVLNLKGNQLTSLPDRIGNLRNLSSLDLENNQLTSLPAEIGNLTNLDVLILHGNRLSSLPESIGNLGNLRRLHLGQNKLTTLPESLTKLIKLKFLFLEGNQLDFLSSKMDELIKKLKMKKCRVRMN